MKPGSLIEIEEKSRISQARRRAKAAAKALGFSEVDRERVGIAVTEAVANVLRHAGRGHFLLQPLEEAEELAAIVWDEGPGISNLGQCMSDGYSSAGGQGIGLGAMKRQSDTFDLYSPPEGGLVVAMSFRKRCSLKPETPPKRALWDAFATCLPMPGQTVSGDAWAIREWTRGLKILLVDGLGHGPKANLAASRAVDCFSEVYAEDGESVMLALNEALRGTRGAVAAVAEVDRLSGTVRYTGMGNIYGRLFTATESTQLLSMSGTIGYHMRAPRSFEYPWTEDSMIVMHSDGVGSRWDFSKFPGLAFSRSSLVAGVLAGGFRKLSDDSSIVCVKLRAEEEGIAS
ncbi:ATP-binding protein [Pelagicoccus sp. SDUM812005]|uniref:ATP-binding protein n=1 Tax=Pelagicoccus sp. SDUM812005 TaxID=3041257 RepID=UPI00280D460A|nr:ATP-binding protein [Pelagicoccus sp. SDUM812005]MDQ8181106.1 ATP-binding protein [Pelagicoccus sp. SDUM812005]